MISSLVPFQRGGEVTEEAPDSRHGVSPALAARIRDVEEVLAVTHMSVRGPSVALPEVTLT